MSTVNGIKLLTPLLRGSGQQRLFEFLDVVDVETAAEFRNWLFNAGAPQLKVVADRLNRSSSGREFASWWYERAVAEANSAAPALLDIAHPPSPNTAVEASSTPMAVDATVASHVPQRLPSPTTHYYREEPNRTIRNAGIPFIIGGYVSLVMGALVARFGAAGALLGFLLTVFGLIILIGGCMQYAQEKGYSKWLGLVGIMGCIGLIILLMIPDRYRGAR